MFRIDTFRLIKKTIKRFLSLVLIVLIGVGFMMGLLSTPTIMRESVDKYDDEYVLHDIQLYSQYGFCYEDIRALKEDEGVDKIFASKMVDVNCILMDGSEVVARITELDRSVDQIKLDGGRLPENANECVVLCNHQDSYPIGQHLRLYLNDEDVGDYLKYNDYLIVGYVYSPEYATTLFGTSNLDNKDLDIVVYVPNGNFKAEYYTTIYLTLNGSKQLISYTDEYNDFIDNNRYIVEDIAANQQSYLKNKIYDEYKAELDEKKATFEEEKAKGQEELDKAKQELEDANIQIVSYENSLELLEQVINKAKASLNEDSSEDTYNEANSYLNQYGFDLNNFIDKYVAESAAEELEEAEESYNQLKKQLSSARYQYNKGLEEYKEGVLKYNEEIEKAEIEIRKAEQDLEDLPKAKWTILTRDNHYSSYMYDNSCSQMQAIAQSLPLLFFLVAALVCMTTMARLIDEQRGQIGIYVALGYSKKQVIGKYVTYAFLASIIGGVIGIFVGQALFPTVIYNTWRLLYMLPDMLILFPIKYVLISLLSFSCLMMFVTAVVSYSTLKEVPANLLRPKAPKISKSIALEKIKFIWNNLSFTSKITARNLFRYKSRFFMTVIGIAGCTALLVLGWGIKDSISEIIEIQFNEIFTYNYQIYLENDNHIDENIEILEDDLNNEQIAPFMTYLTKVYIDEDDDTANVLVFNKRNANNVLNLRKTDKKTSIKLDNAGVIVSQKFAEENNIKKGEYITIESSNGIRQSVRVSEICEMYFQNYIFMSDTYYESTFDETVSNTCIAVFNNDQESLNEDCKKLSDFVSVVDFSSMISQFEKMIEALDLIILVIIITAGSLAFVVIMNLSQVNISERVREIATLKVLGFYNGEVNNYIFKEIIILTLISAILGLPLGVLAHHYIMTIITVDSVMFGMNIAFRSFAYAFIITIVFTLIVLCFMRKVLRQVDMIESLKSVE